MKAWGCITANGTILPRTIRASEAEAGVMMDVEPLARMVACLDVRIHEGWAEDQPPAGVSSIAEIRARLVGETEKQQSKRAGK